MVQHSEAPEHTAKTTKKAVSKKSQKVDVSTGADSHEDDNDHGGGHRRKLLAGISHHQACLSFPSNFGILDFS